MKGDRTVRKLAKESRSPVLGREADVGVEVQGEVQVQGRREVLGEGIDVGVRAEVRGGSKVQSNS